MYKSIDCKSLSIIILIFTLLFTPVSSFGITFTQDTVINAPEAYDNVHIITDPATSDTPVIDMLGGTIDSIYAFDSSVLNLYGGDVYFLGIGTSGDALTPDASDCHSAINIFGHSFAYSEQGIWYDYWGWNGLLTGYWANGDPFAIETLDGDNNVDTFSHIELIVIPEPATIVYLTLASVVFYRRKK